VSSPGGAKRLTKSHDRKLGGVAGGVAEYLDTDPTIVRVLWAIALFVGPVGGAALIGYIIMWFIVPDAEGAPPATTTAAREGSTGGPDATLILGVVILALGMLMLFRTAWVWTSWLGWAGGGLIWPAVLIGIGAYVIFSSRGRD